MDLHFAEKGFDRKRSMKIDLKEYQTVIVYGIGQYYENIKADLFQCVHPDYLCDRKWDFDTPDDYDGIPIIKRKELDHFHNCLVIVAVRGSWVRDSIKTELEHLSGIVVIHVDAVIGGRKEITGKRLKESCPDGSYHDAWENRIYFDETIPDSLRLFFHGRNNTVRIGRNVIVNKLDIFLGNRGTCRIGDRTEVVEGCFIVSEAGLTVGADCLFSVRVVVRNHDEHHIFDTETHKRINYPRDVVIGDHVWIGMGASILAGAKIGNGSIVGQGSVTSGQFGEHQIIAGAPARVIREHVCWSRDNTYYFNHDTLEECVSQEALKYL